MWWPPAQEAPGSQISRGREKRSNHQRRDIKGWEDCHTIRQRDRGSPYNITDVEISHKPAKTWTMGKNNKKKLIDQCKTQKTTGEQVVATPPADREDMTQEEKPELNQILAAMQQSLAHIDSKADYHSEWIG
ncbi:hypothetical protein NDU88_003582 [Pleurodeles waltl]|uniref:Uncharacterized protein n=1 Tax=Pleurodeles waltl TaxID=8319 RepID=A0AAV7PAF8_PLEWA|nr:hypothetical protein NDU88_003582 [Pleurodeles waltl]